MGRWSFNLPNNGQPLAWHTSASLGVNLTSVSEFENGWVGYAPYTTGLIW